MNGEVVGRRLRPVLPPSADPVRRGERRGVQALGQVELVGDGTRLAEGADAVRPPRRREDPVLRVGTARAEVGRRLVHLVHEAHRHEDETRAEIDLVAEHRVERRELDRDLAPLAGRGVLVLDLGVQDERLVELPPEVDDGSQVVPLVRLPRGGAVLAGRVEVLVERLAVAADREAGGLPVDLRGGGAEAPLSGRAGGRSGIGGVAELSGLQLAGQDLDPARELLVRRGRRGLGRRRRFRRIVGAGGARDSRHCAQREREERPPLLVHLSLLGREFRVREWRRPRREPAAGAARKVDRSGSRTRRHGRPARRPTIPARRSGEPGSDLR